VTPPPWRIVFVSTVQPAVEGFAAFARAMGHEPVAVVTSQGALGRREPPNPARRAFFDQLVWEAPPELDIAIASERSRLAPLLRAFEPDLVLCLGFPWRLPPEALAVPRLGCVNSHPSLLPRYRGPSPISWQVRNDERELGVTFHRMDEQFDTGGVLAHATMPLGADDWMPELQPRLAALMPELLTRVFERVAAGDPGDAQNDAEASYAGFFDDEYGELDWAWPADELHRRVRAWSFQFGWGRGARVELDGEPIRLVRTRVERGAFEGSSGDVVRRDGEAILVRCGEDALWVLESEAASTETGSEPQS
jgi:methionyl-tRNA formyltransferase